MSPYCNNKASLSCLLPSQDQRRAHLDAVVDHLDVLRARDGSASWETEPKRGSAAYVTGAGLSDPVAARLAVSLGGSLLEDVLDEGPRGGGSTGHWKRKEG